MHAQNALIQLFKIEKKQLLKSRQWHIYGLTLLRVRLKASTQSRRKLALKNFQIADQLIISSKAFTDLDQSYLMTRLDVYKQYKKWKAIIRILEGLKDQGQHTLSSEMNQLLEMAIMSTH